MNLKRAREKAGLNQIDIIPALKTIEPRMDGALYSKMENYRCLPTPEQFRLLCQRYGASPNDIYSKDEVDFGIYPHRTRKAGTDRNEPDTYKLTVRVPMALASDLQQHLLDLGYPSITAYVCWTLQSAQHLWDRKHLKQKNDRQDGGTSKTAKQEGL